MVFIASGENRRVHLMIGCAGFASRALEIRTATMASAENATDVISRRVRPSRRHQRTESRQPSRRRSRPKWQHWRKSWNDTDRRRRSPNPHRSPWRPADDWIIRRRPRGNQKTLKAGLDQAKAASDESVPLSKRIRAGLKAANDRVQETEQSIVVAQQSLEQHRAKVVEIEKSLQERPNHLDQLHRQAAAEASHGAEEGHSITHSGPRWHHQALSPRGEGQSQESCRPLRGRTQSRGTHAEWMAQVGPRHLVLGQEHRLEAGRCDEDAAQARTAGWPCGITPAKRNALKAKTDSSLADVGGHVCSGAQALGTGVGLASTWLAE